MKLRRAIPTDITASAVAHLSLLALVFVFSEVHPFGSVTAEPIAVDIVAPKEIIETKPEPVSTPTPQPDFSALEKPAEKPGESRGDGQPLWLNNRKQAALAAAASSATAAGGQSAATDGRVIRAGLQAVRARSVDQISGDARPAAAYLRYPAGGPGAGQ